MSLDSLPITIHKTSNGVDVLKRKEVESLLGDVRKIYLSSMDLKSGKDYFLASYDLTPGDTHEAFIFGIKPIVKSSDQKLAAIKELMKSEVKDQAWIVSMEAILK